MTTTATVNSSPITATVSGATVSASVTSSSSSASAAGGVGPQGPAGSAGVAGVAGVAGATGATGSTGAAGPANTLAIGTVTSGSSAAATITGSSPSQTLNLVLPRGEAGNDGAAGATGSQGIAGSTGPAGPANSLSIGTVTEGAVGATITGTSPSQVLNLVLPRGNTGAAGATGSQGIQGMAGSTGAAGPANTLSIGTVSSGTSAAATITGASPSQTLNLVLPKGDTGSAGVAGATGSVGPQGPAGVAGATGAQGPPASLNYASVSDFPATGSSTALYLAEDKSRIYQWESPVYVEVGVAGVGGVHASTHATGESDALTPSAIGAFSSSGGLITGNVEIGSVTLNGLRYLDVSNADTNSGSGSIVRIISLSVDGTRAVPVNLVKYKNGLFAITNVDSDAAACITLGNGNKEDVRIASSGVVGVGTSSPSLSSGVGIHNAGSTFRLATSRTPASSTATGNTGEICWDSTYMYVCVATNTWRRTLHSTW